MRLLQEIKARRADVLQELGVLQDTVAVVLSLMNNEEIMKKMENMRDSKTLNNYLTQESEVSRLDCKIDQMTKAFPGDIVIPSYLYYLQFRVEMMDDFVKLAKYRYECGNYSVSTSYLYFYMLIMPPTDKVRFDYFCHS